MRFCWHKYESIKAEQLVDVMFIFVIPSGVRHTMECVKCGKQKTKVVK